MKVFRIGNSQVEIIKSALDHSIDHSIKLLETTESDSVRQALEYELAHVRTTQSLMKDQSLQELCERCMSYFWNMYTEMGCMCDELEELADDMGLNERELVALFREAGFDEEQI